MSDIDTRTLRCLIEGDSTLFEVTAPVTASIYHLKELIREKRKNGALSNMVAKDLVLWKVFVLLMSCQRRGSPVSQVDIDLNVDNEESLTKFKIKKDSEGLPKLSSLVNVSQYWSVQPTNIPIHVLVKAPAAGE